MSETFLQMKHITKRFPGVLALNDVQFSLRRGEVHALLGENGAGKSTLMKILSGVYQPDEGEIIFEDKPVSFSDPLSAQNVGITIIHQEFNLFPELTVEENIFIGREFCKKNRWRLDEKQQRQATIAKIKFGDQTRYSGCRPYGSSAADGRNCQGHFS